MRVARFGFVKESEVLEQVDNLLGKVLPLGIVTFVMVAAAVIILAWGSWLGQALFQIPVKDSLSIFSGPIVLLAVSLTLIGSFLNHKLFQARPAHLATSSAQRLARDPKIKQFSHVLVPGGKEAETVSEATSLRPSTVGANVRISETSRHWLYEDSGNLNESRSRTIEQSTPLQELGITFIPPERLAARIDAFSFYCHECNGPVKLSWEKVKEAMGNHQLSIDCPSCHRQYPFNYEQAKRKTLNITFHSVSDKEIAKSPIENPENSGPVPAIAIGSVTRADTMPAVH